MGKQWKQWETLFWGAPKSLKMVTAAIKLKDACSLEKKAMTNLDIILKKQRCYFADKGPSSQSYGFSSGHVWMWELDYKDSWALKTWCFWTVVLEKTPCSPRTRKSLLQIRSSKASILWHSAFLIVQLSHPYMTTGKTIALTTWNFVDKVMSLLFNMLCWS